MTFLTKFRLCLAALALSACAAVPGAAPAPDAASRTILISIDGFRPDYLDRGAAPTLNRLAACGVRGEMRPSFPTKTFPNHYALATGLRPDRSGMINNTMEDPAKPGVLFEISNRDVASDPDWWEGGVPVWVSAEKAGVATATMFWPGADVEIHGARPGVFALYDQRLPDFARVDMLLDWLDRPAPQRPQFLTLYFDIVDTAGHLYGPDSAKTVSAVAQVDAAVGRLLAGLEARGLARSTNIVVVSDHGMAAVADDRIMALDARVAPEKMHVVWTGAFAGLSPEPGHEEAVEAALLGRADHGACWRKEDLPERFAYGSNPRVPAIVCLADTGWRYETAAQPAWRGAGGDHGFDPDDPLMRAVFLASGPAFRSGARLDVFDNVSVYPLLMRLIGVEPEDNDGDIADIETALK